MKRILSRRNILRGAGVALTLPWLESLAPKAVRAQAAAFPKRFMPIFLPNGAAELWRPVAMGSGAAWTMSSVLEPLAPLKTKITIISGMENGSSFNADGGSSVEPSHGRQPGAWLTCVDPGKVREDLGVEEANGISIDQQMATHASFAGLTPVPSLQVGLSTVFSFCDGQPCSNSRSVSWSAATTPMYKLVDPLEVFNRIAGVATPTDPDAPPDPELQKRLTRNQTVVDAVLENANRTRARLGSADQQRMDQFLASVHAVEQRVTAVSGGMGGLAAGCMPIAAPAGATVTPDGIRDNSETYSKSDHADVMNDLIVMALQCDVTRIITHMLEDERSEFIYSHVAKRTFTETGSVDAGGGTCPEYHGGGQHGSQDDFASITHWNVGKVFELCAALDAIPEGAGTLLDSCVIAFGGAMHGSNHDCSELPMALIGGGGGTLVTDQHIELPNRPLRDLWFTLLNHTFGMGVTDIGQLATGAAPMMIPEIMRTV